MLHRLARYTPLLQDNARTWRAKPEAAVEARLLDPMPAYENQWQDLN